MDKNKGEFMQFTLEKIKYIVLPVFKDKHTKTK